MYKFKVDKQSIYIAEVQNMHTELSTKTAIATRLNRHRSTVSKVLNGKCLCSAELATSMTTLIKATIMEYFEENSMDKLKQIQFQINKDAEIGIWKSDEGTLFCINILMLDQCQDIIKTLKSKGLKVPKRINIQYELQGGNYDAKRKRNTK